MLVSWFTERSHSKANRLVMVAATSKTHSMPKHLKIKKKSIDASENLKQQIFVPTRFSSYLDA
jgi:hypothetical protein